MRRTFLLAISLSLLALLAVSSIAGAQVAGLYYKEVEKDGRVYVFNTPERFQQWSQSGEMGTAVTLPGRGVDGKTIVGENETAIDLYLFKHNLEGYDRPTPKPKPAAAFPPVKIGFRVYADATSKKLKDEGTGVESADSGVGVDVKRFYFTASHEFDSIWSATFQTDIGDQGSRRYDVFIKQANIQAKISPEVIFRLGSAPTAWIPYVEGLYGFRYMENTLTDYLGFGTSADWGLHFLGKNGIFNYQLSAENGRGFSNPSRSKGVDFEGRLTAEPIPGLNFTLGGYSGHRGLDTDTAPARHRATRTDALVAYANDRLRVGAEYFTAENWNQVTQVREDKADGVSAWASYGFTDRWTVLGRYDQAKPTQDLNPDLEFTYANAGLQYRFNNVIAASLVYKNAEIEGGTFSTIPGNLGSNVAGAKGKYNEVGVWAVYDF